MNFAETEVDAGAEWNARKLQPHWSVILTGLCRLWLDKEPEKHEVSVALIDGRVMTDHPAFASARIRVINLPDHYRCRPKDDAHATFLASMLVGDRCWGLALCRAATLVNIPVVDDEFKRGDLSPSVAAERICGAIELAVRAKVDVIQLSLEFSETVSRQFRAVGDLIDQACARGIRSVVSAGNRAMLTAHSMCDRAGSVPVTATDRWGQPRASSPKSPVLGRRGLRAPGESIPGAAPTGGQTLQSGSSCAVSFVTAAFALLLGGFPSVGHNAIWHALTNPRNANAQRHSLIPPMLDAEETLNYLKGEH